MRSILITGISGFVGRYLADHISRTYPDVAIHGISRSVPRWDFLSQDADPGYRVHLHQGDMLDARWVVSVQQSVKPDTIIHLAAQSSVAESWKNPGETIGGNLAYLVNLLEAVRLNSPDCRVLAVGSAEVYGKVAAGDLPLTEAHSVQPLNPYAAARAAQEQITAIYSRGYGIPIISTRSFNHIGPGQDTRFVVSSLAKQVAEIAREKRDPVLMMGDGSIVRDFLDVRDVVAAYLKLLLLGKPGEVYNVCSGTGRRIGDISETLSDISGVSFDVRTSPHLIRPADNPVIFGSREKIQRDVGWHPVIPFETTLREIYEYWYDRV